jgi:hypothetical protein
MFNWKTEATLPKYDSIQYERQSLQDLIVSSYIQTNSIERNLSSEADSLSASQYIPCPL